MQRQWADECNWHLSLRPGTREDPDSGERGKRGIHSALRSRALRSSGAGVRWRHGADDVHQRRSDCDAGQYDAQQARRGYEWTDAANGVKWAGSNRRSCIIDNDSQSATALSAAQITGRCEVPFAAHIVEVGVWGGTGTGATQAYSGTSSVQLTRYRPNGATTAAILSAALATPGSGVN